MENKYLGNGAFELDLTSANFATANVTATQLRDLILAGNVSSGPGADIAAMPTQAELANMVAMSQDAIRNGRLFDFGHWPNSAIKQSSPRAGRLYTESALGHPFTSPYLFMHTWSEEDEPSEHMTCVYLINPQPSPGETCISFEALSFECMIIAGAKMLCVNDRLSFDGPRSKGSGQFFADVIPSVHRWLSNPTMLAAFARQTPPGTDFVHMAASNILDPLVMALLLLNTRGVQQEVIQPSVKLAKARQRSGKAALPSYRKIDSASYVTALREAHSKSPSQGGHHASPIFHLRRGHWRHYATNANANAAPKRTFIQDTLVNATPEMRQRFAHASRSHYALAAAPQFASLTDAKDPTL